MMDALQDALQRPLTLTSPFSNKTRFRDNLATRLSVLRPAGFTLLTAFRTGLGSSVDELVIGPPGVFVIMTSALSLGAFARAKIRMSSLLKTTRLEARLIGRHLSPSIPVYPVVCVPASYQDPAQGLMKFGEVQVATDDTLLRALTGAPAVLSEQQVLEVAAVIWTRGKGH